jgi:hypothetical protein
MEDREKPLGIELIGILPGKWRERDAMEKVVKVLKSFEESDRADKAYYHSLAPQQRIEILWELNSRWPTNGDDQASGRLKRVYRIIKLS